MLISCLLGEAGLPSLCLGPAFLAGSQNDLNHLGIGQQYTF